MFARKLQGIIKHAIYSAGSQRLVIRAMVHFSHEKEWILMTHALESTTNFVSPKSARLVGLCATTTGDSRAAEDLAQEVLFDQFEVLDFCGPFEVFSVARSFGDPDESHGLFQAVTIAEEDGIIACSGGLQVKPQTTIKNHPPLDILVVPGGSVARELSAPGVLEWVG
jgi:hypothetical protein